jgi:hypothetical protein
MTIHLFILQSLVSAALYTKVKLGGGHEYQRMSYSELREQVSFLSQLFRGEFIFPTEGLDINLAQTINALEDDNVIKVTRHPDDADQVQFVELSDQERETGRESFDFYCFLIWPFIEGAWLGAISLMMLTPPVGANKESWLDQKKVQDRAQLFGKTLYHQGDLSYFEAVNKETLKNAYTRFEEEGMILVLKSKDSKVPSTVRLSDDWKPARLQQTGGINARGQLWVFAERISLSRREGKNRRDGATVQSRVLSLADRVGKELWEEAVVKDGLDEEGMRAVQIRAKGRSRRKRLAIPALL